MAPRHEPVYLILLDGYPRLDSLAQLGIDNRGLVAELERRGFDHYPDAQSRHGWTVLTLTDLLTGEVLRNDTPTMPTKRAVRGTWSLPSGWLAIDPPIGHVVIPAGDHVDVGGINDFEAGLLSESLLNKLAPGQLRAWIGSALADYHRAAIDAVAHTRSNRVFAHIAAPHPAFVLGSDATARCWPRCHLFQTATDRTELTVDEWADSMATQLIPLNALVLDAVDSILARSPDAVIVLFSDHGGRHSYDDPAEWHRAFLAAHTPGHPALFGPAPMIGDLLRATVRTYGP